MSTQNALKVGIELLENACQKVKTLEKEVCIKNSLIEEQEDENKEVRKEMEQYRQEYESLKKNSEVFEEKALAELKRQQNLIQQMKS